MKEERLYIVGYMASGKTTFGRALARKLGWNFVDLDAEVEKLASKSAAALIREGGEEEFRRLEREALKKTPLLKKAVIACGGGTPCFHDNMEFMTLHGLTLWLIASPHRIVERILEAGDTRPLARGKSEAELLDFVTEHLRGRQHHYNKAQWRFSGEHLESEEEINHSVEDFVESFLQG